MIGILALQGNFDQHRRLLAHISTSSPIPSRLVRSSSDLSECHALIIPGGESTVMTKLLDSAALFAPLRAAIRNGFPLLGLCAGAIVLAKRIIGTTQRSLGVLEIDIKRNGYGRQIHSFETAVSMDARFSSVSDRPASVQIQGVFIRAPIITAYGTAVDPLAYHRGNPVVVRQRNIVAATFHPELKHDATLHTFFLSHCVDRRWTFREYSSASYFVR